LAKAHNIKPDNNDILMQSVLVYCERGRFRPHREEAFFAGALILDKLLERKCETLISEFMISCLAKQRSELALLLRMVSHAGAGIKQALTQTFLSMNTVEKAKAFIRTLNPTNSVVARSLNLGSSSQLENAESQSAINTEALENENENENENDNQNKTEKEKDKQKGKGKGKENITEQKDNKQVNIGQETEKQFSEKRMSGLGALTRLTSRKVKIKERGWVVDLTDQLMLTLPNIIDVLIQTVPLSVGIQLLKLRNCSGLNEECISLLLGHYNNRTVVSRGGQPLQSIDVSFCDWLTDQTVLQIAKNSEYVPSQTGDHPSLDSKSIRKRRSNLDSSHDSTSREKAITLQPHHLLRKVKLNGCKQVTQHSILPLLANCKGIQHLEVVQCGITWDKKLLKEVGKATALRCLVYSKEGLDQKQVNALRQANPHLQLVPE